MCIGSAINGMNSGPFKLGDKTEGMTLASDRYDKFALQKANQAYRAPDNLPGLSEAPTAAEQAAYDTAYKTANDAAIAASVTAADSYLNTYGARQGATKIRYQGQPATGAGGTGGAGGAMAGGTMLTGAGETLSTGAKTAKKPTLLGQ